MGKAGGILLETFLPPAPANQILFLPYLKDHFVSDGYFSSSLNVSSAHKRKKLSVCLLRVEPFKSGPLLLYYFNIVYSLFLLHGISLSRFFFFFDCGAFFLLRILTAAKISSSHLSSCLV